MIKKGCSHTDRMATPFDMDGVALLGVGLHPLGLKVIPSVVVV